MNMWNNFAQIVKVKIVEVKYKILIRFIAMKSIQ